MGGYTISIGYDGGVWGGYVSSDFSISYYRDPFELGPRVGATIGLFSPPSTFAGVDFGIVEVVVNSDSSTTYSIDFGLTISVNVPSTSYPGFTQPSFVSSNPAQAGPVRYGYEETVLDYIGDDPVQRARAKEAIARESLRLEMLELDELLGDLGKTTFAPFSASSTYSPPTSLEAATEAFYSGKSFFDAWGASAAVNGGPSRYSDEAYADYEALAEANARSRGFDSWSQAAAYAEAIDAGGPVPASLSPDRGSSGEGSPKPIIIDLDGDGVELLPQDENFVLFDFDDDGYLERTAWVGADDGFLMFDENGDGQITTAREIAFAHWTEADDTDLEGLAATFDSNQDGVLDALELR